MEISTKMDKFSSSSSESQKSQCATCIKLKLILTGDLHVGKTKLLSRFTGDRQTEENIYLNHGRVQKLIQHKDRWVQLLIWDTVGQEKYRSLTASYYRGAQGCLLLFDLTNESTFENVQNWLTDLNNYGCPGEITTILVGTKCHSESREVPAARAEKFAEAFGISYIEVSAEKDINVNEAFTKLVDLILEKLYLAETIKKEMIKLNSHSQPQRQRSSKCSC